MENTKIIFFDIDGTILSHRNFKISDCTRDAINKARENGHLAFINTGRSYAEIDDSIKTMGFDGFVCGCGTYIRYQENDLLKITLPTHTCQAIVQDLKSYQIEAVLEGTDTIYYNYESTFQTIIKQREYCLNQLHFNIQNWDAPDISFDKLSIWYESLEKIEEFLNKYSSMFDYIHRGTQFIEIVPTGYSKASGIEFLESFLNIPHDHTYALGDSANDLSMLKYVKHSIGMGNSVDGIDKIVSFLTKDVDAGGVAHALKHFGII